MINDGNIPPDDEPVIKAVRRGYTINYKSKTLLSTVDPVSQAERAVNEITKKNRTLYFCPSPLFGYGLISLISLISDDSAVLCVETDDKLLALSVSSIDENLLHHPRFAFVDIKNGEELCGFIRKKWGSRAFRNIEPLKLTGGWQLDNSCYTNMEDLIRSSIAIDWGNAMTIVKLGRRFMYNVIRNIGFLAQAKSIKNISFGEKPVLVLGAGPSLDPLLDELQKAGVFNRHKTSTESQNRTFALVCVDTCLTILKERQIIPDLAVILESQFWNLSDFNGSKNTGIPTAVDISAYPGTVQLLGGPVYTFCTRWAQLNFFERFFNSSLMPEELPPLGSVGLSAVELSIRLGSGPVLTGGIDFSFTLDNTHARSSPAHLAALITKNRFTSPFNVDYVFNTGVFDTVSKTKKHVKSNPSMRTYRNLFEKEFSNNRIKDIEGTGLPLGIETIGVDEVIKILSGNKIITVKNNDYPCSLQNSKTCTSLGDFIKSEKSILEDLRSLLTGTDTKIKNDSKIKDDINILLDKADYLWAHFPDCAGKEGRRPSSTDLGFLKRVRAEIDPFIKLWELAERERVQFLGI
ncbi:MAG: DUF115 domain-containing protein [Treponema sp.]|nr:DUF115 domain-containing protein [Treponema sp.]